MDPADSLGASNEASSGPNLTQNIPPDQGETKSVDHVEKQLEIETVQHKRHELSPPPDINSSVNEVTNVNEMNSDIPNSHENIKSVDHMEQHLQIEKVVHEKVVHDSSPPTESPQKIDHEKAVYDSTPPTEALDSGTSSISKSQDSVVSETDTPLNVGEDLNQNGGGVCENIDSAVGDISENIPTPEPEENLEDSEAADREGFSGNNSQVKGPNENEQINGANQLNEKLQTINNIEDTEMKLKSEETELKIDSSHPESENQPRAESNSDLPRSDSVTVENVSSVFSSSQAQGKNEEITPEHKIATEKGRVESVPPNQGGGEATSHSQSKPDTEERDKGDNSSAAEVTNKGDNPPVEGPPEKEDECMDILGNGLLTKKILEPGAGHKSRPGYGDIVTIEAEGKLQDETTVDSGTFTFTVGDGDVVQCWDMALPLMEMNERCELFTGAKYAYGSAGRTPDIPKDADITYTLKLIKKEEPRDLDSLCLKERMELGEKKRDRGNDLFSQNNFSGAINSYNKALKILDPEICNEEAEQLQLLLESRLKCYNNMAACQLKVEAYEAAIKSCESVLRSQPQNVKALFRMGKAYAAKEDTKLAITYLKKALQLEPEAKVIHQELSKLTKKMKKESEDEKNMYRKMLGTTEVPQEKTKPTWWKWTAFMTATVAAMVSVGLAAYRYSQH